MTSDLNQQGTEDMKLPILPPKIGKQWKTTITDMSLIDDTKNAEEPRQFDLRRLLHHVKHGVPQY